MRGRTDVSGAGRSNRAATLASLFKSLRRTVLVTIRGVEEATRRATSELGPPAEFGHLAPVSRDADGPFDSTSRMSIHPRPNGYQRSRDYSLRPRPARPSRLWC